MMLGYDELIFIKEFPYNKVAKFEPPEFQREEIYAIYVYREQRRQVISVFDGTRWSC
jgi:hypothetical protein